MGQTQTQKTPNQQNPQGTQPVPPPNFNPENDVNIFGQAASQRNTQDPNFIANRNQELATQLGQKIGWNSLSNMSDSALRSQISQDLVSRGANPSDPGITHTILDVENKLRQQQSQQNG